LVVTVRYSKTAERTVAVPYGKWAATCPVHAWQSWRAAAGLTEGRAFRSIDRHGTLGASITAAGVGNAISRATEQAGLLVHLTGHSLRSGLATEARRAGHDPHAIATQGGWAGDSAVSPRTTKPHDQLHQPSGSGPHSVVTVRVGSEWV